VNTDELCKAISTYSREILHITKGIHTCPPLEPQEIDMENPQWEVRDASFFSAIYVMTKGGFKVKLVQVLLVDGHNLVAELIAEFCRLLIIEKKKSR
jgi:hypothetical protein